VKGWAVSTAPKIVQLIDEFVINYPQAKVRSTTTKLLASLFKKGTLRPIKALNSNELTSCPC
jgi:hypothetical protein